MQYIRFFLSGLLESVLWIVYPKKSGYLSVCQIQASGKSSGAE